MNSLTGVISKRDFHKAMESHKHYTQSETEFLLSCAETDENELLDYEEFVERFHEPAKVNGVLFTVTLKMASYCQNVKPLRMTKICL